MNGIEEIEKELKLLKGEKEQPPAVIETLELTKTDKEGVKVGKQSNGKKYSVRDNRDRFFYPNEWRKFYNFR